jgi:hypothetical protein
MAAIVLLFVTFSLGLASSEGQTGGPPLWLSVLVITILAVAGVRTYRLARRGGFATTHAIAIAVAALPLAILGAGALVWVLVVLSSG